MTDSKPPEPIGRTPVDDLAAYDTFSAASVVHYFRPDRPGQLRGISDITPAFPMFAQLRRYMLATIIAAISPPRTSSTAAPGAGVG